MLIKGAPRVHRQVYFIMIIADGPATNRHQDTNNHYADSRVIVASYEVHYAIRN